MEKIDEYHIEVSVLIDKIENHINVFHEGCLFIEQNFKELAVGRESEVFNALMAIELYGSIYVKHFEDEKAKVEIFEFNEFQLYQCICRLRKMVKEIEKVANKVLEIKRTLI